MKKIAFFLMILTIISKVVGFFRDITLSYFYGATYITDVYLIATTIPVTLFTLIGSGIIKSYIPLYNGIIKEEGLKEAKKFTSNLINFLLIVCTIIVVVTLIFTEPIIKIFASGFEGATLDLAILFTRISIFSIYFSGIVSIFSGYLNLYNNFYIPALIGVVSNIVIILAITMSSKYYLLILPIGIVLSMLSQVLLLSPWVFKSGYRYNFTLDFSNGYLKKFIHLSLPIIIGSSVDQINVIIDKTIASQIQVGGITALNYANTLNLFIQGVFVASISTAMYPMISRLAIENNMLGLKKSIIESINIINILVIPSTLGMMLFSKPIVNILFGRGAFDTIAIDATSSVLFFYSIGMIGYALREVLSRVFYSLQDTKTPVINASFGVVINIILNIILSRFMGINGLALATSISAIFTSVFLIISLRKKIGSLGIKKITITLFKIMCASLLMATLAKLSFNYLTSIISQNLSLLFSIGIGAVSYFIIIYFMGIEDVESILIIVKKKLGKIV